MNIPINAALKQEINIFVESNSHALLLEGDNYIAGNTLADYIKSRYDLLPGSIVELFSDNSSIGIDSIRQVRDRLKTMSNNEQRLVIVRQAERLTTEAQNAFLKLIEEPGKLVNFILFTETVNAVIETIQSRCIIARVVAPSMQETEQYAATLEFNGLTRQQALMIAGDKPAMLFELSDSKLLAREQLELFTDAKAVLVGTMFQKLALLQKYKTNEKAVDLLGALIRMLEFTTMKASPTSKTTRTLGQAIKAMESINQNGTPLLHLQELALN